MSGLPGLTVTPPPLEKRLNHRATWHLVNSIGKSVWPFEASSVSWSNRETPSNMIRFGSLTEEPLPISAVMEELRKSSFCEYLCREYLCRVQRPNWVRADGGETTHADAPLVFEDPGGAQSEALIGHVIYVFGQRCPARL
jgi:hypothetical protein